MGLPERKQQPEAVEEQHEEKAQLLDASQMFKARAMPFREVEFHGADGTEGRILVQGLTKRELDEINHVQNQPVKDGHGQVIEESNQIGWDALVVARALRNPNRTRVAGEHWKAKGEEIMDTWLPGVVQDIRRVVLELSGFAIKSRVDAKKD
jgi:hypothetical protein